MRRIATMEDNQFDQIDMNNSTWSTMRKETDRLPREDRNPVLSSEPNKSIKRLTGLIKAHI